MVPLDSVYPPGESVKQADEVAAIQMSNSQKDAIAAALIHLGKSVPSTVTVAALAPKSPSSGILKAGDVILTVDGDPVEDVTALRAAIADAGAGNPLPIGIRRGSETLDVSVVPELSGGAEPVPIIGIEAAVDYQFPFDVSIQLQNVGGPSAGQMFALGIIDKLTPRRTHRRGGDRRDRDHHLGRCGRPDRRHPAEAVRRQPCRCEVVPRSNRQLRRGGRAHP